MASPILTGSFRGIVDGINKALSGSDRMNEKGRVDEAGDPNTLLFQVCFVIEAACGLQTLRAVKGCPDDDLVPG